MENINVVFGATGALGSAIVRQLVNEGKPTRAVVQNREIASKLLPESVEIFEGDAFNSESVNQACQNASVIYHCVNVPYSKWIELMPIVTDNILAGACQVRANLVFPGNVYGYGPFQSIPAKEDHPHAATSKKGVLRNNLEDKVWAAHNSGKTHCVIPRFTDFYGPNVTNRLIAPIFEAALAGKKAMWLGKLDVPHHMAYIDDAAAACVLLGNTKKP